jgi:hypothetical protein
VPVGQHPGPTQLPSPSFLLSNAKRWEKLAHESLEKFYGFELRGEQSGLSSQHSVPIPKTAFPTIEAELWVFRQQLFVYRQTVGVAQSALPAAPAACHRRSADSAFLVKQLGQQKPNLNS